MICCRKDAVISVNTDASDSSSAVLLCGWRLLLTLLSLLLCAMLQGFVFQVLCFFSMVLLLCYCFSFSFYYCFLLFIFLSIVYSVIYCLQCFLLFPLFYCLLLFILFSLVYMVFYCLYCFLLFAIVSVVLYCFLLFSVVFSCFPMFFPRRFRLLFPSIVFRLLLFLHFYSSPFLSLIFSPLLLFLLFR